MAALGTWKDANDVEIRNQRRVKVAIALALTLDIVQVVLLLMGTDRLIRLLWRIRPPLPSTHELSIHSEKPADLRLTPSSTVNSESPKHTWYSRVVPSDQDPGKVQQKSAARPNMLYAPVYNGLSAALAFSASSCVFSFVSLCSSKLDIARTIIIMTDATASFKDVPEVELGEALTARTESLATFRELGPPDLLCHIVKSTGRTGQRNIGSYHFVSGVDASSSASLAAYINSLIYSIEDNSAWFSKSMTWKVRNGCYCCFNAFSHVDIRVDVKIPGGVFAYVVDLRGERDSRNMARNISLCAASGHHLFRRPHLLAAEALFMKGWQVGSDPVIQVATVVSNHLTAGVMKYFGDSGRCQPAANSFEKLSARELEIASFLAKSYIGMNEEVKAVQIMSAAMKHTPQSYTLLHVQSDFLRSEGRPDWALKLVREAVNCAPSEFVTWEKLTKLYIDTKDYESALLTVNSCPMFTFNGRDAHRALVPAKVHLPFQRQTGDILPEKTKSEDDAADPALLRLPAPGLRGTWARAYSLLTRLVSDIGWDELLKTRSVVFVMEEEYRMQKAQADIQKVAISNGAQCVNKNVAVIHEDGSVTEGSATLADDDASTRGMSSPLSESESRPELENGLNVSAIQIIRVSSEYDMEREIARNGIAEQDETTESASVQTMTLEKPVQAAAGEEPEPSQPSNPSQEQNITFAVGAIAHYHQNSRYYSAVLPPPNPVVDNALPHITIQMPVYKESLATVLTPSLTSLKTAVQTYARHGGTSSLFINNDRLRLLPPDQAKERIECYATHGIGWIARPRHGHEGQLHTRRPLQKASNMNYILDVSLRLERILEELQSPHSSYNFSHPGAPFSQNNPNPNQSTDSNLFTPPNPPFHRASVSTTFSAQTEGGSIVSVPGQLLGTYGVQYIGRNGDDQGFVVPFLGGGGGGGKNCIDPMIRSPGHLYRSFLLNEHVDEFTMHFPSPRMHSHGNLPSLIHKGFPNRGRAPPPPIPHATRPPLSPYMSLPPLHPPPMPVPQFVNLTDAGITDILIRFLPYFTPFVALPRNNSVSRHYPPTLRPIHFIAQAVRKICTAHVLHKLQHLRPPTPHSGPSSNVARSLRILQEARDGAVKARKYDSVATRAIIVGEFEQRTGGKVPYSWQLDVSEALLLGLDCSVIAGIGAGKTMPFVLPLLAQPNKHVLIISPLNALEADQAEKFRDVNLTAVAVNGNSYNQHLHQQLELRKHQVIITSPEMCLNHDKFRGLISSPSFAGHIAAIVIDEAHCISQWGEKFREEYAKLGTLRAFVPSHIPVLVASATLPPSVLVEVRAAMHIDPLMSYHVNLGIDRLNIAWEVRHMKAGKIVLRAPTFCV
ncbi:Chs5p-Arf1p-binding proteins-domain-containing protein [Suillus lakei]|nr:Chs5p-Arf1p-binding proteins-domain-containing protein [Suillus lakei]